MSEIPKHKIFISYHHSNDQQYKEELERILGRQYAISRSVQIGDIDPNTNTERIRQVIRDQYLSDSTVTIVLIGTETWKRKHIDWEIYSSMRNSANNPRSGVIGLLLPTRTDYNTGQYSPSTVPKRLTDNTENGFVKIYNWTASPDILQRLIHEAYLRKSQINPDLSSPLFRNNRS